MQNHDISFTKNELDAIAEKHFGIVFQGEALRSIAKRQVTRLTFNGEKIIIKAYKRCLWQRLLNISPGSTAGTTLLKGFTPPIIADFIYSKIWRFIVFLDAGQQDLYHLIKDQKLPENFRELYQHAGKLLADMHNANLYHADCKTPNFVVNSNIQNLPQILVVDCDRVIAYKQIPYKRRIFNLAQFIACNKIHPDNAALYKECMKEFLNGYAQASLLDERTSMQMLADAIAEAEKNPRIEKYVSSEKLNSLR